VVLLPHIRSLILLAAAAPLAFYAAAIICAWDHFRQRGRLTPQFSPPLSILKPMRGPYRETYLNLESFCRQDYPRYEILFCVDRESDPAVPAIRKIIAGHPGADIRLVVGYPARGTNDKVNKLCRLDREARYDLLVITDGDIRVEPDYLRRVAAAFEDPHVGAATCLYRGRTQPNLWSELEDLNLTTEFLAGVLVARKLGVNFALGATMAIRREALAAIGGFEPLANAAADDHELGSRAAAQGFRVGLTSSVVETECTTSGFAPFLRHHLRWAVATRTSQPWGHVGFLFAQGLFWTVVAVAEAPSWQVALAFAAAFVALRLAVALALGSWGLRDRLVARKLWLLPLRDALGFAVWLLSLFVSRVHWQDAAFDVRRGQLIPVAGRGIAGESPGVPPTAATRVSR
jgi:ceramide glucosyltransferase